MEDVTPHTASKQRQGGQVEERSRNVNPVPYAEITSSSITCLRSEKVKKRAN